jgi:hypothetical protein
MLPQAADSRARPRLARYLITGRIGADEQPVKRTADATLMDNDGPAVESLAARRAGP